MDITIIEGVGALGLVIALVQLVKALGFPSRFAGLLAIGVGVATTVSLALYGDSDLYKAVIAGLVLGLSAAGLWSTTKNALSG